MNPFSRSRSLLLFILLLTISPVYAILDTNQNGASDLWERHHNNGNLYSNFIPTADPDGDGWTNAQEAAAGTHPDDANPPTGFLRPEITRYPAVHGTPEVEGDPPVLISPEAVSIEWTPLAGKKYSLFASSDLSLGSWISIGEPQIGNRYFTPSFNIPLTQPDGSIPQKLFFRLSAEDTDTDSDTLTDYEENQLGSSPYYADGDHDGISDYDEFMIHHTNFNATDSDNDGVTDGDEILVNFTNPLSTTDADGDGIPDDFEKHFAKLLLAYEPKATHWGAYHTSLLAGNLDATHDYTGDGMNVRELAGILNTIPAAGPADSGYTVESEIRRNSLQSAYYYPLQSSSSFQGTYSYSVPNDYDVYESVTLTADLSSQYLLSRIDGVAWGHPWMRSGDQIYVDSVSTESAFRRTPVFSPNGTKFQGRMGQQRCRIIASNPGHKGSIRNYLKLINESNYFTWNNRGVISAEPFKVQFPKGRMVSDWYEFKSPFVDETGGRAAGMSLVPMEVAPEVLAVNSDFDEGRIDSATGYAIPDCDDMPGVDQKTGSGNTQIALNASRAHLDGLFANDEKVTDDMHKGWFGVNPNQLGDDFWSGANVTIRKIDKIDSDTGYKESGQVRFYAKWSSGYYGISPYDFQTLQPVNLVSAGVNLRPNEGVYGSTSTIPGGAEFYMEGVRPGKITLEWRLQKGTIDVKHEQTFLVATQKTKQAWIDEVIYQVKLQTSDLGSDIDLNDYDPANGFFLPNSNNYKYIQTVYYYYMQLFQQYPEKFYWAGMAKTAGASVYAGMVDMATWKTSVFVSNQDVDKVLIDFMIQGNKDIFTDMAWAHHAYAASGIEALDYVEENETDRVTDFDAWRSVNEGFQESSIPKLREGNKLILRREQEVVMPPLYDKMKIVWLDPGTRLEQFLATDLAGIVYPPRNAAGKINIDEMFSINSRNPVQYQLGPSLRQVVPNGKLSSFNDRWAWIDNPQNGMLQIWLGTSTSVPGFPANERSNLNGSNLTEHAKIYSMLPTLGGLRDNQFPPPPW